MASILIDANKAFQGDQGASDVLGQLYRAQWDDWKTRFRPYIDQLADIANSSTFARQQGEMASAAVNTSYANTSEALKMQRAGMGLQLTPAQSAVEQRKLSLGRAADSAAAFNQASISARDLQDNILAGGMGLSNIPNTGQVQQG
ncbi:hypothetical protein WG219_10085 [Ectopseudomonas mendocina]|uniref:Uncharacterized protein n=1 Tax=Ectopseudomonas mendocina TaxID=300 RepID=A0ABZ2RQ48_ECTME